jgi:regulator of protease activity HflC (stomatin/prohibitin superfamily)
MMAFIQAVPQTAQIAGDLLAKSFDWPGAEAIADRLKKALPPGIVDEEMTPEQQQAQQMAMQQQQEAQEIAKGAAMADAQAKQADAAKKAAEAEGQQLENAKLQFELSMMTGQVQDLVQAEVQRVLLGMMQPQEVPQGQPI